LPFSILTWLLRFMGPCFAACPDALHVRLPKRPTDVVLRRLEAEAMATHSHCLFALFCTKLAIASASTMWLGLHGKDACMRLLLHSLPSALASSGSWDALRAVARVLSDGLVIAW
jgi:hypothetical protein